MLNISLRSYATLSAFVFGCSVGYANMHVEHATGSNDLWEVVDFLTSDGVSLVVSYNTVVCLLLILGRLLLRASVGKLRDTEVEQIIANGRGFLADTVLFLVFYAPTIFGREARPVFLIHYISFVAFVKVFHLMAQIRVNNFLDVGTPKLHVTLRLLGLLYLLVSIDTYAIRYFSELASPHSTFYLWLVFEGVSMGAMA